MTATVDGERSELQDLEEGALRHLEDEEGRLEADIDAAADEPGPDLEPLGLSPRLAVAVGFPVIACAVLVGGVFTQFGARVYAAAAGLLGIGLAYLAGHVRRALLANVIILVGLFVIGLLMVVPGGPTNIARVGALASSAAAEADLTRPPVPFSEGWKAITGWLMGIVGFAAAWLALVLRRPSIGMLIPLPVAGIAAISVPDSEAVASGIVALVLFAVGLGLLSSEQSVGEGDERPPIGYELRKAARALPLLAVITAALVALAQTNLLFPASLIDPAQEPQRPKTVPISEVEDRVLFEVESSVSGPWRIGSLDVYDQRDFSWRLPPFAAAEFDDVPESGIVDPEVAQGVRADFTIRGLGGAVLPGLPNTAGIIAAGPRLTYDPRSGNIRLAEGQIQPDLRYTVVAAALPRLDQLRAAQLSDLPPEVEQFTEVPDAPLAVIELMAEADRLFDNVWDKFDHMRNHVLDHVVASGPGVPVEVSPARLQDMLSGSREGSPFEIVAAQAMLARWLGLPSRIGYGFDGGEQIDDGVFAVRPRHGASFVEVYFPGYKWLPVIGTPRQAQPTVGSDPGEQQIDPNILPSDDAAAALFLPILVPPDSVIVQQVGIALLIILLVVALAAAVYSTFPALRKARLRSRRRAAALAAGPRARIALAYAEWRDHATDLGFKNGTDTPLMFLERFVPDEEHTELAWLTTRALWGDLQDVVTDETAAAAEELSRSLRRRLSQSQPSTLRFVGAVSRLSLRDPYAPAADLRERRSGVLRRNGRKKEATDAPVNA
jgi:hypothetical protein